MPLVVVFNRLNVMYKWDSGPNEFSPFCQSGCISAQNPPAACTAKSRVDNRWQQPLNMYKLQCAQENDLPLTSWTLTFASAHYCGGEQQAWGLNSPIREVGEREAERKDGKKICCDNWGEPQWEPQGSQKNVRRWNKREGMAIKGFTFSFLFSKGCFKRRSK